jgi:hypothetical protein
MRLLLLLQPEELLLTLPPVGIPRPIPALMLLPLICRGLGRSVDARGPTLPGKVVVVVMVMMLMLMLLLLLIEHQRSRDVVHGQDTGR